MMMVIGRALFLPRSAPNPAFPLAAGGRATHFPINLITPASGAEATAGGQARIHDFFNGPSFLPSIKSEVKTAVAGKEGRKERRKEGAADQNLSMFAPT